MTEERLNYLLGTLLPREIKEVKAYINSLKSCMNCFTDDGYDCRMCIRNTDHDNKPGIVDNWVGINENN